MSNLLNGLIGISLLALAAVVFQRDARARDWKRAVLHGAIFVAAVAFLRGFFGFLTTQPVARGHGDDVRFIVLLYIFMVLGMFSSYAYKHFSRKKSERPAWDLGLFLAPAFVSPIVFIPLLTAFQKAGESSPTATMFLVAFQNGFLWKEYFDQKRKSVNAGQ